MARVKSQPAVLKGWKEIAQFLGQPSSTIQRWAKEGMPVERKGRMVQALADKLNLWLERETREPVQIATELPIFRPNYDAGFPMCATAESRARRPE
jgi:hypothetical protein